MDEEKLAKLAKLAAENPGLLEFPHSTGSAPVVPTEEGAIKKKSLDAMAEQTTATMDILADFMQLAMNHAKKLQDRVEISQRIYDAKIQFTPIIGHTYFLYEKTDGSRVISLVAPDEWTESSNPHQSCEAKVRLLSDHTWDVVERYDQE